ncbi:hypothetical protein ACIBO5_51685 [Nonomuraea angiospora]|uniref:hypothetical protein n=1 Tax=Nonomuraea angiospora TaxID=46172 RepID=UPI003790202A
MLSEVAATARVTAALLAQYAPPSEPSQNCGIAAAARPPVIAKTSAPVSRRAALRTSLVSRSAASRPPITRGRAPAVRPAPRGSSAGKATRSRTTVRLPGAWAWLSPIATVCKA